MFHSTPNLMSTDKKNLEPGFYAIVDWVANNPMSPNLRYPVLIAMNITPEQFDQIKKGEIPIPTGPGTVQRAYLKIEDVIDYVPREENNKEEDK